MTNENHHRSVACRYDRRAASRVGMYNYDNSILIPAWMIVHLDLARRAKLMCAGRTMEELLGVRLIRSSSSA